jgi:predicted sulfurtransferase
MSDRCGVVILQGVEDQNGYTCSRTDVVGQCFECGTKLCKNHVDHCDVCNETFCDACLSFHTREHAKPAIGDKQQSSKRKTA